MLTTAGTEPYVLRISQVVVPPTVGDFETTGLRTTSIVMGRVARETGRTIERLIGILG